MHVPSNLFSMSQAVATDAELLRLHDECGHLQQRLRETEQKLKEQNNELEEKNNEYHWAVDANERSYRIMLERKPSGGGKSIEQLKEVLTIRPSQDMSSDESEALHDINQKKEEELRDMIQGKECTEQELHDMTQQKKQKLRDVILQKEHAEQEFLKMKEKIIYERMLQQSTNQTTQTTNFIDYYQNPSGYM